MLLCLVAGYKSILELKVGALLTSGRCCDFLSFENKGSALTLALEQLSIDGILNNETVQFK